MNPLLSLYPTAGVFRRLAAMTYDALLLTAISIAYYAIAVALNVLFQGAPPQGEKIQWGHWNWLVFIGWLSCMFSFYCFFWKKTGQTLGMRAWRMRVIGAEDSLTLKQCLLRCALALPSLLLLGLGYVWLWFDPQRITFHDRFSNTRVIVLPKDKN